MSALRLNLNMLRGGVFFRAAAWIFLALLCVGIPKHLIAQVAGPNVNMVSGTQWPTGDPFLQRQNEPSMAVSTRNPLHILAGILSTPPRCITPPRAHSKYSQ